jgi:hypothetical protein
MDNTAFPWLKHLPEDEQDDFLQEIMGMGSAGVEMGWTIADFVKKLETHIAEWKATAQAHADGLPEILATATTGDFGEVQAPEAPYEPRYTKGAIIARIDKPGHGRRYRVTGIRNGYYILTALFGSLDPDRMLWKAEEADQHTELEWTDDQYKIGLISGTAWDGEALTAEKLAELGVSRDDF